ncbi:MAG: NAD(P)-dependent oxidoreductase [Pseudomonadota bacterium]
MRYGFVGLGNLGGHLAESLLQSGFEVTVTDLDQSLAKRHLGLGARWASSPAQLAQQCDAVITCLPSPKVTEQVLDAMLPAMREGAVWIEMSTIGPDAIKALSEKAAAAGVQTLEAPVTGGVHLAARGEITVLLGGDADLIAVHRPAFEAMGGKVLTLGPLGAAAIVKVITNMLAFIHLVACGEGLMLAQRGGIDLAKAWEAIAASSGSSFVHETEGQLILNGSYDIAFTMDLALKDLGFAEGFGRDFGVPLALTDIVHRTFKEGRAAYGGDAQSTQIVKLLEDVVGTPLRAPGFPARLE